MEASESVAKLSQDLAVKEKELALASVKADKVSKKNQVTHWTLGKDAENVIHFSFKRNWSDSYFLYWYVDQNSPILCLLLHNIILSQKVLKCIWNVYFSIEFIQKCMF